MSNRKQLETLEGLDRLLTVEQTASLLGESTRTLQRRLKLPPNESGSIPYVELSGVAGERQRIRFKASSIQRWIDLSCPCIEDFEKARK